jgi:hypothetical protein
MTTQHVAASAVENQDTITVYLIPIFIIAEK